jgi:hypothetical protein
MILLNNVADILHLADFNGCAVLVIILFKSRLVGSTSGDGDLLRNSIVVDCFNQESFGGQLVSVLGQQEVNGFAFFVNDSIQRVPFTFDLDVGLIHSSAGANSFLSFPERNFKDRSIFDDLSLNHSVIELNASFFHDFFDITIAQVVPQIPENC